MRPLGWFFVWVLEVVPNFARKKATGHKLFRGFGRMFVRGFPTILELLS